MVNYRNRSEFVAAVLVVYCIPNNRSVYVWVAGWKQKKNNFTVTNHLPGTLNHPSCVITRNCIFITFLRNLLLQKWSLRLYLQTLYEMINHLSCFYSILFLSNNISISHLCNNHLQRDVRRYYFFSCADCISINVFIQRYQFIRKTVSVMEILNNIILSNNIISSY